RRVARWGPPPGAAAARPAAAARATRRTASAQPAAPRSRGARPRPHRRRGRGGPAPGQRWGWRARRSFRACVRSCWSVLVLVLVLFVLVLVLVVFLLGLVPVLALVGCLLVLPGHGQRGRIEVEAHERGDERVPRLAAGDLGEQLQPRPTRSRLALAPRSLERSAGRALRVPGPLRQLQIGRAHV